MLVLCDENKTSSSFSLSSLSNSSIFILTALNLSVWQDSSWSDMSAFIGETATTNGFDFLSCNKHNNLVDNRDKRFNITGRQSTQTCLARLKMKQGLELLVTRFFLSFHRLGYPKREKANFLVTLYLRSIELFRVRG